MNATGFIETRGLIPAIEAADVMLKTAQVELVERSIIGGGIVTITVTGDIGAVKSAIDAGASSAQNFGREVFLSQHIIPRPSEQLAGLMFSKKAAILPKSKDVGKQTKSMEIKSEIKIEEKISSSKSGTIVDINKLTVKEDYKELNVKELRKLAKKYGNLGMTDEELKTANRAVLRQYFEKFKSK
ncbi:BMC domain-containing protein [Enterococcus sp. 22-H-5-01]|uniref:BMC domain-containing protein n=1 Tax=Enterococcus sp. 22-H-5-01 TaxID=3418555 RepID=UPI003CFE674A